MWEESRRGTEIREKIETWREQRTLVRKVHRLLKLARVGEIRRGRKEKGQS